MRTFGLVLYFIFLIALVTFAVFFAKYNAYFVNVGFFGMYIPPAPLWVVAFLSFFVGFVTSSVILSWKLIRLSLSRKKYMKSYESIKTLLEQKIKDLKTSDED
ncbi:MAG: hypothetical protein NTY22_07495 [Proteobacteria bacterium]|nr:hypothetical protein [Pseudomonadota bacterium]